MPSIYRYPEYHEGADQFVNKDLVRPIERQRDEAREEITTLERNLGKALSVQRQYFNDFQREQAHRVAKEEEVKGLLEDLKTALQWIDDGIDEEGDQEGRDLIVKPMMAKHFDIYDPE